MSSEIKNQTSFLAITVIWFFPTMTLTQFQILFKTHDHIPRRKILNFSQIKRLDEIQLYWGQVLLRNWFIGHDRPITEQNFDWWITNQSLSEQNCLEFLLSTILTRLNHLQKVIVGILLGFLLKMMLSNFPVFVFFQRFTNRG